MKRTLWQVISILAILHLLMLGVGVAWLSGSGRLNGDRVDQVVALFDQTIEADDAEDAAEAVRQKKLAAAEAEAQRRRPDAEARREADRWAIEQHSLRLERLRDEIKQLDDTRRRAEANLERQRQQLAEERRLLDERVEKITSKTDDEGFKQAVGLYESLPAKQVKQQFMKMLENQVVVGQADSLDQVVGYLKAMEPRKAASVLKEFKADQEIVWAVKLMERLRGLGQAPAGAEASG